MANSYYISEINVDGVKYNILDEQAKSDLLTLLGSHELQPLGDSAFKSVDTTIEDASTGVPATLAIKNYVDDSIESLGVVLDFKGIKDTIAELPSTGNENGDVWLVRENTSEYIWVNDEWEEFGPAIDLSPYATISYVDNEIDTVDTELTAAINNKVDKVTGKSLSTNDYTTAEKTKLEGIEAGAQVNPDLTPYATTAYVDESIYNYEEGGISQFKAANLPSNDMRYAITYGNGKFITVSRNNKIASSEDGINWTEKTFFTTTPQPSWNSITYGNGKFVAVGLSSTKVAYSEDGTTWKSATLPSSCIYVDHVSYGNGKFIVLNNVNVGINKGAYSEDGINWTEITLPASSRWTSAAYGGGKFVAVAGGSNKTKGAYSEDGISWTEMEFPNSRAWYSVTYGNGKFVVVTQNSSNIGAYSEDGINWTEMELPVAANWSSVTYGNGEFIAIANGNKAIYSEDGTNWTEVSMPVPGAWWYGIAYGDGKFVAVANGENKCAYSVRDVITIPKYASNDELNTTKENINKLFPIVRNSNGLVAKQSIYNDIESAALVDLRVVCSGRIVGTGTQSISNPYSLEAITDFDITVSQNEDLTDGTIYNVNLQNSLYKFTYYLSTGLVEADNITSVDLGTLNWEYDSENSFFYTDDLDGITFTPASSGMREEFIPINAGGQVFCTSYAYANYRNGTLSKDGFCLGNGSYSSTTTYLLIKDSNYSDVATFKTAVSGQLLYYPIAEGNIITYNLPIITVQLFDGINYIYTDGFNNIADYYSIPPYSTYMQKDVDYVTAGRNSDTSLGNKATAEGHQTTASGNHSHAEGYSTKATNSDSHAEGFITEASGDNGSHAEGNHTIASGSYGAHAEGFYTVANGERAPHAEGVSTSTGALSFAAHAEGWETAVGNNTHAAHAEGFGTIAESDYQHVSGKYNISDNSNTYAEIIGNGTSATRSNARTLDWSGNEWLAGKITVGADPTNDMDVATKQYVDQAIAAALASLNQ